MAYAALISLKHTIQHFLNSSHTPVVYSSREILESAYKQASFVQQLLKELYDSSNKRRRSSSSNRRWNALDVQIKEAAQQVEDALEFKASNQFLSQHETHGDLDFEEERQEINSFVETMKKLEAELIKELQSPSPAEKEEEDDDDGAAAVSSNINLSKKMVGLSNEFTEVKDRLFKPVRPYDFGVFSLVGKVGSCRTFVGKSLYDEIFVGKEQPYDCGAWVTIGRNYQFKEILVNILAQIDDRASLVFEGDEEKLGEDLYASLKGRRYMIVMDDIDSIEAWDYLRKFFPEQDNGSLILLTTGLMELAQFASNIYAYELATHVNDHRSWDYLRLAMFGIEYSIDLEFEKAGKKIAENCRGSRIALAKVILFLNKAEKTPENWSRLAAEEHNPVFMVEDEISEIGKINEEKLVDEKIFMAMKLVDLSCIKIILDDCLFPKRFFPKTEIFSLYGMAGIGKTTIVKNIFEDSSISHHFTHRVWVTLGPQYKSEEIFVDILAQIYPEINKHHVKVDVKLAMNLSTELSHKRCLIVLDDLWSEVPLHHLKTLFPDIKGSILVTTRLLSVCRLFGPDDRVYTVRLLNKEESWDLLCEKVFAGELCPPDLKKVGQKISDNCEGLPLLILTIANLLSKSEKTLEYWNMAAEKRNPVFIEAYNLMLGVLYPSYEYLPQHLKACFLYMGVFPQNYESRVSKVLKLWVVEGVLESNSSQTMEDVAIKCLKELVDRSLVMVLEKGSDGKSSKTCSLHSVFWHLCNSEAVKSKFFHALSICGANTIESLKGQRRMCVRNNVLLGLKDVHNSMQYASNSRSLLCTGPPHQYPVPIAFRSRLLRVLEAVSIRLYEFPIELVELVHLRYLALTCNGRLPPSISKLRNLENFIVRRHLSTNTSEDSSFLPMEIWRMKELKYLRVTGCNLPNPSSGDVLTNLLTLLDVGSDSCTEEVLKGVPNLRRLGVQIELEPDDDGKPFRYLNHISCLSKLESLKCVVVNPELSYNTVTPPTPHSMFPPTLKKLSLSGLGYPWSYMGIIGRLENLEVLKLRCYAFQGPKWETEYNSFSNLKFLVIEDTDLVVWRARNPSFFSMKHLKIKHCYKLEELLHYLPASVQMLEVVDCDPAVVAWAEQMKEIDLEGKLEKLTIHVHSSWDDLDMK